MKLYKKIRMACWTSRSKGHAKQVAQRLLRRKLNWLFNKEIKEGNV